MEYGDVGKDDALKSANQRHLRAAWARHQP